MTQPPGPYGGGYGQPGPYEPSGQPVPLPGQFPPPGAYGQQPGYYGQPPAGFGQPGPPQPPPKRNLLPWFIVGGAVLLSGLGILLVVLLRGDDTTDAQTASNSTAASTSSAGASANESATPAELPPGAQVAEESTGADQGRYPGSGDAALAWVQAMAEGEFQTAYDLSCADVQTAAAGAAAGEDPAWELGTYFFEQTLGGQGFTDGSFDSIQYSEAADSDVASFTLQLDNGEQFLLMVYVQPDGLVCDFI